MQEQDVETTQTNDAPAKPKRRWKRFLIGAVIGAGLGLAYYSFIGCQSGGCPITSNPYISTAYGAVFGSLIAGT